MYKDYPNFKPNEVLEYDRKSRSDDPLLTVEETLKKHGEILDDYAKKFFGDSIPLKNKYKEVGSSETIDGRPEMTKLLKAVESPDNRAILCVDVQRLSRGDLEEAGRLIKLLRYSNTYVITPYKIYDLRDEYDREAFERELKKGNDYLEYFKKIQARGRLASVKEGNYLGSVAPYGYERTTVKDGKKDCPTLVEKKEEADIVRNIFDWYCNEDIGVTAICRRLESLHIKTKTGGDRWKASIIFSMLENVHYIGCVRWNWRKEQKLIEDQEVKKIRPKAKVNEYMIFDGKHKGIVSEEIFNKAQQIRGHRHRTKTDTTLQNPFSGLMYCSRCGAKIGYNTYRKDGIEYAPPKLKCNNQVHCKSGSADFNDVMTYICNALRDCISDFELKIDNKQDNSDKLHKSLIDGLEKHLKDLEARELEQWKSQTDPDPAKRMPDHVFKILNEQLLKEKAEVKEALCEAYETAPRPVDYKERVLKFQDALNALTDDTISAKIKNQYLREIIERIDYDRPPTIRITKKNAKQYETDTTKGLRYHIEPYTITLTIRD